MMARLSKLILFSFSLAVTLLRKESSACKQWMCIVGRRNTVRRTDFSTSSSWRLRACQNMLLAYSGMRGVARQLKNVFRRHATSCGRGFSCSREAPDSIFP